MNAIIDIAPALDKYKFNGKEYVEIETKRTVNSKFMKNNSEPFMYTLGLMFEMTRVLIQYGYEG